MAADRKALKEEEQRKVWTEEQLDIASRVIALPDAFPLESTGFHRQTLDFESMSGSLYGGVDVSFPENDQDPAVAVYVVLQVSLNGQCTHVYSDWEYFQLTMPYIPSFLAFREIDPLVRLVNKQRDTKPDCTPNVILVDGNGIFHPRRAGLACFLGVRTCIPTIGIGKTLFAEGGLTKETVWSGIDRSVQRAVQHLQSQAVTYDTSPYLLFDGHSISAGSSPDDIIYRGELHELDPTHCFGLCQPLQIPDNESTRIIAYALVGSGGRVVSKTKKTGSKLPIFVSVGHNISLSEAVRTTAMLSCVRIPEPVRQADLMGRNLLRQKATNKSPSS